MQKKLIEDVKSHFYVSDLSELKYGSSDDDEFSSEPLLKFVPDEDIEEVAVEFVYQLDKANEECCDNYRVYPEHMSDEFNEVASQGCCGSHDWTFKAPNGNVYLMGFNYGH